MPQKHTDNPFVDAPDVPNEGEQPTLHEHIPSDRARKIGQWVHEHKDITSNNLFGYTGYQYLRSAVAAVPYGFSMAGTWLAFDKLAGVAGRAEEAAKAAGRAGTAAKYSKMYLTSPLMRTSAMIGTSFSLYRATSKIGKWVNEYLFDPKDSLETTIDKVEHLPEELKHKMSEVYLPEFHSTLISSMVLGGVVTAANHATVSLNNLGPDGKPVGEYFTQAVGETKKLLGGNYSFNQKGWSHFWKEVIANPKSNFVGQAALFSLAYSLFFDHGDRRFIAKQETRGLWQGRFSVIGDGSRANPSLLQPSFEDTPQFAQDSDDVESPLGELPEGSRMGDKLSVLTSEPSALRWGLRRFLPTAVGITGYTALKFRAAPLFLGKFTEGLKNWSDVPLHAWREGAATSLFFMIPFVSDKYAPVFDKAVNTLEAKVSGRTYEEVIAGYQPKRAAANVDATPADSTLEAPSATVQKPATHEVIERKQHAIHS
jgi:hypothetical protein